MLDPDPAVPPPEEPGAPQPRLVEVLDQLDAARRRVVDRVRALSDEERSLRAPSREEGEGGWTAVQVVDHLRLVEHVLLEDARSNGPRRPPPSGLRARAGKFAVALVFRFGVRVRAPTRRVLPGAEPPFPESLDRWEETGSAVRAFLVETAARDPNATALAHPVSGGLSPLDTARFLLFHLLHHERQLDRILRVR